MKPTILMSEQVYEQMLDALNNQYFTDRLGKVLDMDFINKGKVLPEIMHNLPKKAIKLGFSVPYMTAKQQRRRLLMSVREKDLSFN